MWWFGSSGYSSWELSEALRGKLPQDHFDTGQANFSHGHETISGKKKKSHWISMNLLKDNSITFCNIS